MQSPDFPEELHGVRIYRLKDSSDGRIRVSLSAMGELGYEQEVGESAEDFLFVIDRKIQEKLGMKDPTRGNRRATIEIQDSLRKSRIEKDSAFEKREIRLLVAQLVFIAVLLGVGLFTLYLLIKN